MIKQWEIAGPAPDLSAFAAELSVTERTAEALWHRGIQTVEEAGRFLHPEEVPYADPFLMKDMDKAVERLQEAIEGNEHITVYGDYDVDGMTATSLMLRNLRKLGADVDFYIPDRMKEGYGFNADALAYLADHTDLLVSVDCGIASVADVGEIKDSLDIVITDHHLPGAELPPAIAVLDPHREDCPFPEKDICGAGVAFKLLQALFRKMKGEDFDDDLELVAIATVADIVPLVGENRKIVKEGLRRIADTALPGVAALIDVAGLKDKDIGAGHIGFMLAPRLNAAGRIGTAKKGVSLLTAESPAEAESLAKELDALNHERQDMEQSILEEAIEKVDAAGGEELSAIVVAGKGWNPGVIGIVASRLVERYYRPTIVFSIGEDGVCKGSCRSIKGLNIFEALSAVREHIIQFGGHAMAAGLTVAESELPAFREALSLYCRENLTEDDYTPKVSVEFLMKPEDMTFALIDELSYLEPYGMGNPKPLFGCRDIRGTEAVSMGREGKHLRFEVGMAEHPVRAIMWGRGNLASVVNAEPVDIVYAPSVNEWKGRKSLQCMVESMSPAETTRVFPTRDTLVAIYRYLVSRSKAGQPLPFAAEQLAAGFAKEARLAGRGEERISYYTMKMGLRVFEELGILRADADESTYTMPPQTGKLDLDASPTYRRGMRHAAGL